MKSKPQSKELGHNWWRQSTCEPVARSQHHKARADVPWAAGTLQGGGLHQEVEENGPEML